MKHFTKISEFKIRKWILSLTIVMLTAFQVNGQTVVDIIVNSDDHTSLETAVVAAGLDDDLSGEGPFTVFAPTDAAFDALPPGTFDYLLQDPEGLLTDILLYHVIDSEITSSGFSNGQTITTMVGEDIVVTISNGDIIINNEALITTADIQADNGVVHVIDAILTPPITVMGIIRRSPDHETLEAAINAAGLSDDLSGDGPFTVFAPTDAAFEALPAGTLDDLLADPEGALTDVILYHVVQDELLFGELSDGQVITTMQGENIEVTITNEGVFINDAQIIVADLPADNGIVHVIDAVLIPESYTAISNPKSNLNNISISPNPASDFLNISLELKNPQATMIEIFTISGKKVSEKNAGMLYSGNHSLTIPINNLNSGIYFIVVGSDNNKSVAKVQIAR